MIKDYLKIISDGRSSRDFIVFSSILFSLGFILSIISNAFFFIDHVVVKAFFGVANTVFFIGVIGLTIVTSKWFKGADEKLGALSNLYLVFTVLFGFLSYFVPFLFLVTSALLIALILTAKYFLSEQRETDLKQTVTYFLITLSFYTMELVTELNDEIAGR